MKRLLKIVFCAVLSILMASAPVLASDLDRAKSEMNDIRRQLALPVLSKNVILTKAAQNQAAYLAARNVLSHTAGGNLRSRVRAAGFGGNAGENLGRGQKSVSQVIIGWMNSPGHRANILNGNFNCFGLASSPDKNGKPYWVLLLGGC